VSRPDSILSRWEITEDVLTQLVDQNPSLRGIMLGYVAEKKFHDKYLNHADISEAKKDDDHSRKRKGDRRIVYKNEEIIIEVKSLQTAMVQDLGDDHWKGKTQVDASDNREVTFPNGTTLKTTCLLRGEFHILAVNCFAFGDKWRFQFALNSQLPQNTFRKYTPYQQQHLLPTLLEVSWPPEPPFTDDLTSLLETFV